MACLDLVPAGLPACVAAANEADVLLVGAPTINRDAPKGIWDVVTSIDAINVKGKAAGAFGSFGWSGEAPGMLHTRLGQLKYAVPEAPFRVTFTPTDDDKNAMADYARSVAALCKSSANPHFILFRRIFTMDKYVCDACGYVYDPAVGDPDHGIAPGTPFEALPEDWTCPLCGLGKDIFSKG